MWHRLYVSFRAGRQADDVDTNDWILFFKNREKRIQQTLKGRNAIDLGNLWPTPMSRAQIYRQSPPCQTRNHHVTALRSCLRIPKSSPPRAATGFEL